MLAPSPLVQVRFVHYLPLLKELIDNAITYSAGSTRQRIHIELQQQGFEHGSGQPELRVHDSGKGMSKELALGYFVEGHTTAGRAPRSPAVRSSRESRQ